MGTLMIGNVDNSASDAEIRDLLTRYGFPPYEAIEHMPGDGTRPAVLLSFPDASAETLRILQPRIQNLFWKNRRLNVMVMEQGFGTPGAASR